MKTTGLISTFATIGLLLGGLSAQAAPGAAAEPSMTNMTKGRFAVVLARAARVPMQRDGSEREAAARLRGWGLDLGTDLGSSLTEGDLVRIGEALGVTVTSQTPENGVSPSKGRAFAQAVRVDVLSLLATLQGGTLDCHVSYKGRKSREVRRGTPASPANINAIAEAVDPDCPPSRDDEEPLP